MSFIRNIFAVLFLSLFILSCKTYKFNNEMNLDCKGVKIIESLVNKNIDTIYYLSRICNKAEYVWYNSSKRDKVILFKVEINDLYNFRKIKLKDIPSKWKSLETYSFHYSHFGPNALNGEACFNIGEDNLSIITKNNEGVFRINQTLTFDMECVKKTIYEQNSFGRYLQKVLSVIINDNFYDKLYSR
jgi:hypothetical protein